MTSLPVSRRDRDWLPSMRRMRHKAFSLLVLLALLLGLAACSGKATPIPSPTDPMQTFEQEVERLRKELKIPGMSVAVIQEQEVIFARGFGYADLENQIPATEDTPYNIASCTKPFAAVVLMQLVEKGQLDLDAAMADILKDTLCLRYLGENIRGYATCCRGIGEILQDTSSPLASRLGSTYGDYHCDTERITVRHHLTHTSEGVPGETYRYNGGLYALLSVVAEEVSGKSFDELLVENIIRPLEMTRTVPSISESHRDQVLAELARYYRVGDAGDFVLSQYPPEESVEAPKVADQDYFPSLAEGQRRLLPLSAAGGMISTVLDLAKFDVAMDQNLLVSEESKEAMFTPTLSNNGQPLPYGLGWFVQEVKGTKLIWHYGYAPGAYSSLILKVPEEEVTLIFLANSDGASAGFYLGDGDVLRSPFAVTFLNLFTDLEVKQQW